MQLQNFNRRKGRLVAGNSRDKQQNQQRNHDAASRRRGRFRFDDFRFDNWFSDAACESRGGSKRKSSCKRKLLHVYVSIRAPLQNEWDGRGSLRPLPPKVRWAGVFCQLFF